LVVAFGLGNPGGRYDLTRHNIGKEVVEDLIRQERLSPGPGRGRFLYACRSAEDLCLVLPTTFVNSSGASVVEALDFLGAGPADLLVVFDDFSLPLGSIRIRKKGSGGGHNGLASIIYQLESETFPRLRLGIGPLPPGVDPADFVLSRFEADEQENVRRLKEEAVEAVLAVASMGVDGAMNKYNKRVGE
jgi:PTH1 family peptidyl-tRNA hydrolase